MFLVVLSLCFFMAAFAPVPDMNGWAFRQMMGLAVASLIIVEGLRKKYHWSVALCFASTAFGCFAYGLQGNFMVPVLFAAVALLAGREIMERILQGLAIVAIGDAIIMLIKFLNSQEFSTMWWVQTNSSLDASFLAIMLPVLWLSFKNVKWPLALVALAIFLAKSNTALFAVAAIMGAYFISSRAKWENYAFIIGVFAIGVTYMYFHEFTDYQGHGHHKFLEDNGRFHNWQFMMEWWKVHANMFFGTGPGTYWAYAIKLQPNKDAVFIWMHNDWLQQLFTHGVVGLLAMITMYLNMIKRSFRNPQIFSMVVGYGFIALTQFPNHLFFFQVLGASLIYHCFDKEGIVCQMQSQLPG